MSWTKIHSFNNRAGTLRKSQEFHACLSHGINPRHASRGFDADSWVREIEAQKNLLVYQKRSDRLNRNSGVAQIADDAAVALIQIDVSQALNLVAIVTSSPDRCETASALGDCATRKSMAKF